MVHHRKRFLMALVAVVVATLKVKRLLVPAGLALLVLSLWIVSSKGVSHAGA